MYFKLDTAEANGSEIERKEKNLPLFLFGSQIQNVVKQMNRMKIQLCDYIKWTLPTLLSRMENVDRTSKVAVMDAIKT